MRKTTKELITENTGLNLLYQLPHLQNLGCTQQLMRKGAGLGKVDLCFPSLGGQCGQALQRAEQSQPSRSMVSWKSEFSFGQTSRYLNYFISQCWSSQKTKLLQTALTVLRPFRRMGKSSRQVFAGFACPARVLRA